jgi:putative oxidoreductase
LLVGICEFGGGLLFALGLFSPLGSLGIAAAMLTAIAKVHWPKVWATEGGIELPLVDLVVVVAVGVAGPGKFSLDNAIGTALPEPLALIGLVLVLAGWIVAIATSVRRPTQEAASKAH